MNTIMRLMLVSMLMVIAAPAYSATAVHVFTCEQDDEATEEQIEALASKWLNAARKMKGGEKLEAYVYHPVAVKMNKEEDILFVVVAPSFAEWGVFWDGYKGSAAEKADEGEIVTCPGSSLWESVKVK